MESNLLSNIAKKLIIYVNCLTLRSSLEFSIFMLIKVISSVDISYEVVDLFSLLSTFWTLVMRLWTFSLYHQHFGH